MELNKIYHGDCFDIMPRFDDGAFDAVITDIPYNEVNRKSNGLRIIDKEKSDVCDFDISDLVDLICMKAFSHYVFCGWMQLSEINKCFRYKKFSTRVLIWEKTNPSPMNGKYIWLSGIEPCHFARRKGAIFNEHCKNTVLRYPSGQRKIHPTQKNLQLIERLILASTKLGDVVCDPFIGSGTTAIAALNTGRQFVGIEKDQEYYEKALARVDAHREQMAANPQRPTEKAA